MKISRTVSKLQSGRDFVLETATCKVQRGVTKNTWSYGPSILHVVIWYLIFV